MSRSTHAQRVRVTGISLARRPDRWAACEQRLASIVPDGVEFDMFAGTDAAAAVRGAAAGEGRIAALETASGCTIYRGWPITEVDDVRRCFPHLAECADAQVWMRYEKAFAAAWRSDRARLYIDFFNRHLAVGEMGASLSHYRVAERAHADGLDVQIVFEDDAIPSPEAITSLLHEVSVLAEAGVAWDLIYLHSAPYSRQPEPAVQLQCGQLSSRLRIAGHRKVCHAYALSSRGAEKLARCGYRASVFPYDDFLPALHAGHPRPDVMALPCVRFARGESTAQHGADGAGGDEGEAVDGGPFVALTFRDEAALCVTPPRRPGVSADSDSKAGAGSAVLLGDLGVAVDGLDDPSDETVAALPEHATSLPTPLALRGVLEAAAAYGEAAADAAPAPCTLAHAAQLAAHLEARSFARVAVDARELRCLLEAEDATAAFLGNSSAAFKARHLGRGGREGDLMLWSCGYTSWPNRQQWHVVCGAPDAQPWPDVAESAAEATGAAGGLTLRASLMAAEALLRRVAMASLTLVEQAGMAVAPLRRSCASMGTGTDPSVLDAFLYAAPSSARTPEPAAAGETPSGESGGGDGGPPRAKGFDDDQAAATMVPQMAAHYDPGVLTLTRASECPGLELYDTKERSWLAVEAIAAPEEVLILCGEQLETASRGRIRATKHRVAPPPDRCAGAQRCSVVFELRAPPTALAGMA